MQQRFLLQILKPLLHLVGILFPHINDDARSESHQTLSHCSWLGHPNTVLWTVPVTKTEIMFIFMSFLVLQRSWCQILSSAIGSIYTNKIHCWYMLIQAILYARLNVQSY